MDAMDAKLMVATDRGDVKKLKDVLNKNMEDAMAMVVVTATSKKPSEEDQSSAGNIINPLLLASARMGSWKALNDLLERGGATVSTARDVEDQPEAGALLIRGVTPDGDTALHAVARNHKGGQDFFKYASNIYHRDRGLLFAKNHKGGTPLHCAARAGNSKMVSHLIDLAACEGADTKLRLLRMENNRHETALHEAVLFEDSRILDQKEIEALLADLNGKEENKDADADGAPEDKSMVRVLMGADPELANYHADDTSPLYLAIMLGNIIVARTLYAMSGGNLSYSGADGQNALHVAVLRSVMVELLLDWNKSLTTRVDKDGSTPLHYASSLFDLTTFKKVFQANPTSVYQADNNGSFPIHVAASVRDTDVIKILHNECPDSVGLCDAKGRTFLHVAVEKGGLSIVCYVCRTPSLAWILNMQDNNGSTALHLAIHARGFRMFCALFGNLEVNLNLTDNHGQTPFDLSESMLSYGIGYEQNSESRIYDAMRSVGAHGARLGDKNDIWNVVLEEEKKLSEKVKDATQTLIVVSVLIATVGFSATFALPGGYIADDHPNRGTPTLAGGYVFDAFIMATTLAFICSAIATGGFAVAAVPMVNLFTRTVNFYFSVLSLLSSVTSMCIAFALGVYMVLAPVAHTTAVAVCVIVPAVLVSTQIEPISRLVILAQPLCIRKGLFRGMVQLLKWYMPNLVVALWPVIVTFGWAAFARIHHRR